MPVIMSGGNNLTDFTTEERAGGVIYRISGQRVEYLLVTSNSNRERWIIPAGHIEDGETAAETAIREVEEEAGVRAKIVTDLGTFQHFWYRNHRKIILNTHLYLMDYLAVVTPDPEGRQVGFYTYEEIRELNLWDESKVVIEKADRICRSLLEGRNEKSS
jgi:8-oxo-dGTP pyrophosphatase MutT (NUDIX family)